MDKLRKELETTKYQLLVVIVILGILTFFSPQLPVFGNAMDGGAGFSLTKLLWVLWQGLTMWLFLFLGTRACMDGLRVQHIALAVFLEIFLVFLGSGLNSWEGTLFQILNPLTGLAFGIIGYGRTYVVQYYEFVDSQRRQL